MSKFTSRRLFKQFRKEGVPFLLAAKTSKILDKDLSGTSKLMELSEFSPALSYSCECCGLPMITFTTPKGSFILDVWRRTFH